MKGFQPQFNKTELNTKQSFSFIELGVKQSTHNSDCECEECISLRGGESKSE